MVTRWACSLLRSSPKYIYKIKANKNNEYLLLGNNHSPVLPLACGHGINLNYMSQYSKIATTAIVTWLANVLPLFGLTIGSDQLTNIVQSTLTIVGLSLIWYFRFKQGGINIAGKRI
jgi:hypothetical protein